MTKKYSSVTSYMPKNNGSVGRQNFYLFIYLFIYLFLNAEKKSNLNSSVRRLGRTFKERKN